MEPQLSFYDTDESFEIWLDCWSDTYLDTDDYEFNQLICK